MVPAPNGGYVADARITAPKMHLRLSCNAAMRGRGAAAFGGPSEPISSSFTVIPASTAPGKKGRIFRTCQLDEPAAITA
eukprot:9757770-Alexandrium_andersonii.AAC.1